MATMEDLGIISVDQIHSGHSVNAQNLNKWMIYLDNKAVLLSQTSNS